MKSVIEDLQKQRRSILAHSCNLFGSVVSVQVWNNVATIASIVGHRTWFRVMVKNEVRER